MVDNSNDDTNSYLKSSVSSLTFTSSETSQSVVFMATYCDLHIFCYILQPELIARSSFSDIIVSSKDWVKFHYINNLFRKDREIMLQFMKNSRYEWPSDSYKSVWCVVVTQRSPFHVSKCRSDLSSTTCIARCKTKVVTELNYYP